ncbi:hypothetical protein [Nocardioides aurantiacus]|uniref:Membrane protein YfhO n=1 Tax=Nocardioides aurantiacus TaxID=86796 RepID=A0A3N2CV49_9ACTN|nr:hypothetical protein [Nocardioides aurantiacus]ROR91420.1 hypothetical protein EDD33_2286 [Nocardioides aurantiacus]
MAVGRWAVRLWPWLLAGLFLGPAVTPGHVLAYDMVFVPDLALRPDSWGLGSSLPRAVPSDALVALVDEVVPGSLLQPAVLLLALVVAGAGAARLVPSPSVLARLAATTAYVWNPFVAERLGIGHWPLLLTYAALPWLLVEARRLGRGDGSVGRLLLWTALGSLSPAGGVMAVVAAVVGVASARVGPRTVLVTAVGGLLLNAPWVVAGALHGTAGRGDPAGAAAFAAQGEGLLPAPLAVLGLGGIWNTEVVPASRQGWPAVVALVLLLALGAAGLSAWRRDERSGLRLALPVLAGLGLVVALAGWASPGAVAWLGSAVPGAGLLRDGTRWVALLSPWLASLVGLGVARAARAVRPAAAGLAVGTLLVLAPVALAPDVAGGLGGRLVPVEYPAEHAAARAALDRAVAVRDGGGGDVLLLPFSSYRAPSWNGGRRVLDPLGRFLAPDFLQSDDLYVSGRRVAGEDPRAARVARVLERGGAPGVVAGRLRAEGIGWVVLDREAQARLGDAVPTLAAPAYDDPRVVHEGRLLVVWELPGPVAEGVDGVPAAPVAGAWVAAGLVLLLALGAVARHGRRTRRSVHPERLPGGTFAADR